MNARRTNLGNSNSQRLVLQGKKKMGRIDTVKKRVDEYFFVKNKYSIVKHFVPFAIAAILLVLLLSFQKENDILFQLLNVSQKMPALSNTVSNTSSRTGVTNFFQLLPLLLLASVTTIVYYYSINFQIHQAYLWPKHDARRTFLTFLVYLCLCTALALIVLYSSRDSFSSFSINFISYVFVSYLVAALSLTGIGWGGPSSWVEAMGIKSPDYTDGRQAAERITKILFCIRNTDRTECNNYEKELNDFKKSVTSLKECIEVNIKIEPEWGREELKKAIGMLFELENMNNGFVTDNEGTAGTKFGAACNCGRYPEFCRSLNELSDYWPNWKKER
jgi:hypothetical protein